ncbi:hypothetical protein ACKVWL_011550, partial [Pyricularia oryzae]
IRRLHGPRGHTRQEDRCPRHPQERANTVARLRPKEGGRWNLWRGCPCAPGPFPRRSL